MYPVSARLICERWKEAVGLRWWGRRLCKEWTRNDHGSFKRLDYNRKEENTSSYFLFFIIMQKGIVKGKYLGFVLGGWISPWFVCVCVCVQLFICPEYDMTYNMLFLFFYWFSSSVATAAAPYSWAARRPGHHATWVPPVPIIHPARRHSHSAECNNVMKCQRPSRQHVHSCNLTLIKKTKQIDQHLFVLLIVLLIWFQLLLLYLDKQSDNTLF